ncbi:MAG: hypothetical protein M3Q65_05685 [Chloroflexota bacterium]|nr:hypothetical protein [Chloroflexota bacterium]
MRAPNSPDSSRRAAPACITHVAAVAELERLVGETVAFVETQTPEVATSRVRQHLEARRQRWAPALIDSPGA